MAWILAVAIWPRVPGLEAQLQTSGPRDAVGGSIASVFAKNIHSWEWSHIPLQGSFEDEFPFPKRGYVNSLEGNEYPPNKLKKIT